MAPRYNIARLHCSVLSTELADLRSDVDYLTVRFTREYGGNNEASERAQQLAAAIQRLEWALARQQLHSIPATPGG
jgi:hypothetical protein